MSQNQFPPEQPLTVTLQAQEWNLVMTALFELPAKVSYGVIGRLQQQFTAQPVPLENGGGVLASDNVHA